MTRWITDQEFDPTFPVWTRANAGEVLPEPPSPLGWDLTFERGCVPGWRDCAVNRLGSTEEEMPRERPPLMSVFGGYAYLGATFARIWGERTPGMSAEAIDAAYYGDHPDVPPYRPEPWHENAESTAIMEAWLGWALFDRDQSELEELRAEAEAVRDGRPDLSSLSDAELVERATAQIPLVRRLFDQHINQTAAASIGPGVIAQVSAALGEPESALKLIAGLGGVDSAAPSYAMWTLSRTVRGSTLLTSLFDQGVEGVDSLLRSAGDAEVVVFVDELDEFLAEFGSRGPNEWDLHADTWETDPTLALAAIDRMRLAGDEADPRAENDARARERSAIAERLGGMLDADQEAKAQFEAALASAAAFVPGRERCKTAIIRVVGEIRMAVRELGRRAVDRGEIVEPADLCMLFVDELEAYGAGTGGSIAAVVAERLDHHAWLRTIEPPFIIASEPPPVSEWPRAGGSAPQQMGAGDQVTGVPGCPGVARGRARVVLDPSDPAALGPGDILVAPVTDPAWTPLFVPAAG
ncbi:MAG: hypothetical protein AAGA99_27235, partial [Actinomycetota bacterium]